MLQPAMDKTNDAFRTIGEVAETLDLPQHVLRFWETKFVQIKPVKRAGGRRYYRPEDVQLVAAIRVLLYSEGYTIKGVQRILKEQGAKAVVAASLGGRSAGSRPEAGTAVHERLADQLADLLPPLESPQAIALETDFPEDGMAEAAGGAGTRLSAQDRHRMQAILAELGECARLLQEARRG
jgi:DNA-binding transcriptional MerR regulator